MMPYWFVIALCLFFFLGGVVLGMVLAPLTTDEIAVIDKRHGEPDK